MAQAPRPPCFYELTKTDIALFAIHYHISCLDLVVYYHWVVNIVIELYYVKIFNRKEVLIGWTLKILISTFWIENQMLTPENHNLKLSDVFPIFFFIDINFKPVATC